MARVVPVGPIDPELYAFAKKEAEKAERNPRYAPKKRETHTHTVFYRRAGATVKAFVIDKIAPVRAARERFYALPIVQNLPRDALREDKTEFASSNTYSVVNSSRGPSGEVVGSGQYVKSIISESHSPTFQYHDRFDFARQSYAVKASIEDSTLTVTTYSTPLDDNTYPRRVADGEVRAISPSITPGAEPFNVYRGELSIKHTADGVDTFWPIAGGHFYSMYSAHARILHGLAPVLTRMQALSTGPGSYSYVRTYTYPSTMTYEATFGAVVCIPNPGIFDAKEAADIVPGTVRRITHTTRTTFEQDPMDFGFTGIAWVHFDSGAGPVWLKSAVAESPNSRYSTSLQDGVSRSLRRYGVDAAGNFFHVDVRQDVTAAAASPPWEYSDEEFDSLNEGAAREYYRIHDVPLLPRAKFSTIANIDIYKNGVLTPVTKQFPVSDFDVTAGVSIYVELFCSAKPKGGAVVLFGGDWHKIQLIKEFDLGGEADLSSICLRQGIFIIGRIRPGEAVPATEGAVLFIPNPNGDEHLSILTLSKVGEDKNYHILRPHKEYEKEEKPNWDRFSRATLFAGKNNRCYISFDDGMCVDLSSFADELKKDPGISAQEWNGSPFKYSPIEPVDYDGKEEIYPPRRIKRDYAPQWVRAYYDYEDAQ